MCERNDAEFSELQSDLSLWTLQAHQAPQNRECVLWYGSYMSEHCHPVGINFNFLCFQGLHTLEVMLLFPISGLTSGSYFQFSVEVTEEMTPSCLTSLQNTWGVGTGLQAFGYWYKCLLSLCGDLLCNTGLTEDEDQLFIPTFSGFWPKALILWFLLKWFFWFCRDFGGFFGARLSFKKGFPYSFYLGFL